MKRKKNSAVKRIVLPLIVCCAAAIVLVGILCNAAMHTKTILLPENASTGEAIEPEEGSAVEIPETDTNTEPQVQEIDGAMWYVHDTLPIREPIMSPEEAEDVSITIEKEKHLLTLYSGDTPIAQYTVGLACRYQEGDKVQEGDKRNPIGTYSVCVLNNESKYYLALGLNYPNADDAKRGLESGLISQEEYDDILYDLSVGDTPNWYTKLGGQIMIHGQKGNLGSQADWTLGCFAVDNPIMDILWKYCTVGTKVTILA